MNMSLNSKAIGVRLKKLRDTRTQQEVADAIGVTTMAISQYENGERIPRDEIKIRLANYFNETVENLFFKAE